MANVKDVIHPVDDFVVIEELGAKDKTPGGIILPDNAKQKPYQGKVVAVGPGKRCDDGTRNAVCVKVGDTVLFGKYSGADVELDGKEFKIIRESEIFATLTK